jgi:hypothetical protein
MKRNIIAGLAAVALSVAAAACVDSGRTPVAPNDPVELRQPTGPQFGKWSQKVKVDGVRWQKRLDRDISASALIGPQGGVLTLPATGLRLVVPAGAVSKATRFAVTALSGKLVAYDFEPAGSVFPVALRVEQDPSFIDLKHTGSATAIAGYFPSRADLDQTNGTGDVAETIPVTQSSQYFTFPVWHFSGYIVSWGRDASEQ